MIVGDRIGWRCHGRSGAVVSVVYATAGRQTEGKGDETLTETCEGAVGFMVVEVAGGSLRELPVFVLDAGDGETKGPFHERLLEFLL